MSASTSGLGVGPDLGAELGARVALGPGALAFSLRGAWVLYTSGGTLSMPCTPASSGAAPVAPNAPCVSQPSTGSYDWSITEVLVRVSLPVSYRFLSLAGAFNAYVGVAPTLTVQRAETTAFNQRTVENAARFGVHGFAGVQLRVGPGAAFFEAGYAWSPVSHRATGDVSLGAVQLAVGYRLAVPSS